MEGLYAACRYVCGSLTTVTAATSALSMTVMANTSSTNLDMRRQVVNLTGILNVSGYTGQVTRGNLARMLMNVSSYRENPSASSVSVFADVPSIHPDTIYIRVTASQRWMAGSLGGLFKPEGYIACKDTMRAALTMSGYSDKDLAGGLASSRILKFNCLELNEEVNRQPEKMLNQTDYMNIFYNLLKTRKEDNSEIHGAVLDCELNSDGEISPITVLDDKRKGPILARKDFSVIQSVPFGPKNANALLNGTASILEAVKTSQQDADFAVVYYNMESKTIWTYTTRGRDDDDLEDNNAYVLLKGEVRNIHYRSTGIMTPTSIHLEIDDGNSDGDFGEDRIDGGGYLTINLNSSEFQCLFSIYGGIEVGDEVVAVCNKNGSNCTAVDAIEY